jgi:hypothetical protein
VNRLTLRRSDSERNHHEHEFLMKELRSLNKALNGLVCYPEVYADLGTAEQVHRCGRELREALPTHFAYEEQTVLEQVAALGPAWRIFALEMRRQHLVLQSKLEAFLAAVDRVAKAADLEDAVDELKQRGRELAKDLAAHMSTEERRFSIIPKHS